MAENADEAIICSKCGASLTNQPEETAPAEEVAIEATPVEETPAEEATVEETPAEETPAEEVATEAIPVEETPAEEAATEETPAEETPTEEVATVETHIEQAPAEETPAKTVVAEETPVVQTPAEEAPAQETPAVETEEKNFFKKAMAKIDPILAKLKITRSQALIGVGVAIAAIIVISILLTLIFPSPKAVVKKMFNGIVDEDAKAVVSCMPAYLWDNDREDKADLIDSLDAAFEKDDFNFTYEINKIGKYDDAEVEKLLEDLEDMEKQYKKFDADKVTDYREVLVKILYEKDGEESHTWARFTLIKYKGQWKALPLEVLQGLY